MGKHKTYTLPKRINYSNPSPEQIQAFNNINSLIAQGTPAYKAIQQMQSLSRETFYNLISFNESLKDTYARACEEREVVMFDKALEVACDSSKDWYVNDKGATVPNPVTVQRSRLITDTILKMLATMNHKKYGNRLNVDSTVTVMQPLTVIEAEEILKDIE